jgi:hypothetical protein
MAGHRQGRRKERTATKRADASRARFADRISAVTTPREQVSVAFDYFRAALKHATNRPATKPDAERAALTLVRQLSDAANRLLDAQIRSTNDR